jgi:copper chaperone CopZ
MSKIEISIEGMTCGHCSKSVTDELEAIAGVSQVKVDHDTGKAVLESDNVSNDQLSEAVAEAGYTAKSFATLDA